jgi:hypothetical protein
MMINVNVKVNVKLSSCLTKHHAMKAYWGSEDKCKGILHFKIFLHLCCATGCDVKWFLVLSS